MNELFPITLRAGTPDDVDALIAVGRDAQNSSIGQTVEFQDQMPAVAESFATFVRKTYADLIVAEHHGTCLGFTAIKNDAGRVNDLWVAPTYQGCGVGAMLLTAAEARVRSRGFTRSWLTTHAANTRAIGFYRTHGYGLIGMDDATFEGSHTVHYRRVVLAKQFTRPEAGAASDMAAVRVGIDTLDPMLVSLIAERFAFIDRAAALKPKIGMPARVTPRVEEVVANARKQAEAIDFDPDLTETLWRTMIDLAIKREETEMHGDLAETGS